MTKRFLMATLVVAGSIVGLGGTAGADPLDAHGYVRVVHGDLAAANRPVAVTVDGQPAGQAAWAGASPWRPVTPGRHRIAATGGTDTTIDVGAGCGVTLVTGQGQLNAASRRAVAVTDCQPARLEPDQARISAVVVNSPSFGPVDVEVNGTHLQVEPQTAGPGAIMRAGALHVTLRDPKTGAVFLRRDVRLEAGTISTLALLGGGEAGVTLAVVGDAAQAREVPPPGRPIHTGPADTGRPTTPLQAAGLLAVIGPVAVRLRFASRPGTLTAAVVAAGLLLAGCAGRERPAAGGGPADRPPATRPIAPPPPSPPTAPRPGPPAAPLSPPAVAGTPASNAAPDATNSAVPASLRIARLNLNLPVGRLDSVDGLPRSLPTEQVAWLSGTAAAGMTGTTAIVGHTGRGPFARLSAVRPGDELAVTDGAGRPHTYRVVSVSTHRKDAFPPEMWAPQRVATLVLITCTGGVYPRTGLHTDNLVVRAIAA